MKGTVQREWSPLCKKRNDDRLKDANNDILSIYLLGKKVEQYIQVQVRNCFPLCSLSHTCLHAFAYPGK